MAGKPTPEGKIHMANRLMTRNYMTLEKGPVALYTRATIGAVGAPTLVPLSSKGVYNITRTGVGAYDVKFGLSATAVDTYQRLMAAKHVVIFATSTAANMVVTADSSAVAAAPKINIQFLDYAGVAVELGVGAVLCLEIILSNSTAV